MRLEENKVDQCIYLKVSGSKFIFLLLYVDDILLAFNNLGMLHETKDMATRSFDMKDLGKPLESLTFFILPSKFREFHQEERRSLSIHGGCSLGSIATAIAKRWRKKCTSTHTLQFFGHNTNERPTRSNFSQVTTIVVYEDVGDFSDNEDLMPSEITFYRDVCGEEIFEGKMVSSDEVRDFSRDKSDLYEDMTSP
ncbi:hypothetical protein D0Y65_046676 [Glycine soja]|uniref:Reverse transcriptase Ty1/copia-type domain-containing protein n=1 Tax=Glycine soja TaxID=3848 RepID=A0A445GAH3_GLYSO|nr:hypothetical protein D0Y65_046676 [Glycine soja]